MASPAMPATMHSALLVIDANEGRAQCAARVLTLADYCPYVTTTPFHAFQRLLQEQFVPHAVLLGQVDTQSRYALSRLVQKLSDEQGRNIPVLPLQECFPFKESDQDTQTSFISAQLLEVIRRVLPLSQMQEKKHSLVLDLLPTHGLVPRVSKKRCSGNGHFRQMLQVAYKLIGAELWATLMQDVGLVKYARVRGWPPNNDIRSVPAEYLTCLHQAVARSRPDDPISQLRSWSNMSTQISLQKRHLSTLTQQMLHLLPEKQVMSMLLKSFTSEMNTIRDEELHMYLPRQDGCYWLVHYSNLYVYGRTYRPEPVCHVWSASLEATLHLVGLDATWEVTEVECSCQTQTGHCLFIIWPKGGTSTH